MNIDDAGHKFGGESAQYEAAVRTADGILSMLVPEWLALGCSIFITSDHGMSASGQHGGTAAEERSVPLYVLGDARFLLGADLLEEAALEAGGDEAVAMPQLLMAPLMCRCLGIAPSAAMMELGGFKPPRSRLRS